MQDELITFGELCDIVCNQKEEEIYFAPAAGYEDAGLVMPERSTEASAGYDLACAEDVIIPPYTKLIDDLLYTAAKNNEGYIKSSYELDELADLTKLSKARPTLVSTGLKCHLPKNCYLEICVRSSTPLKYWLMLANAEAIIDADYFGNASNDGLIYLQLINLSPFSIQLRKGDIIGQGIIKPYLTTTNDNANKIRREGGLGSTSHG